MCVYVCAWGASAGCQAHSVNDNPCVIGCMYVCMYVCMSCMYVCMEWKVILYGVQIVTAGTTTDANVNSQSARQDAKEENYDATHSVSFSVNTLWLLNTMSAPPPNVASSDPSVEGFAFGPATTDNGATAFCFLLTWFCTTKAATMAPTMMSATYQTTAPPKKTLSFQASRQPQRNRRRSKAKQDIPTRLSK